MPTPRTISAGEFADKLRANSGDRRGKPFRRGAGGKLPECETNRLIGGARTRRGAPTLRKRLFAPPPKVRASPVPPTRFAFAVGLKSLVKNDLNLESGSHLQDFWHTIVPISTRITCFSTRTGRRPLSRSRRFCAAEACQPMKRQSILTSPSSCFTSKWRRRIEGPRPTRATTARVRDPFLRGGRSVDGTRSAEFPGSSSTGLTRGCPRAAIPRRHVRRWDRGG